MQTSLILAIIAGCIFTLLIVFKWKLRSTRWAIFDEFLYTLITVFLGIAIFTLIMFTIIPPDPKSEETPSPKTKAHASLLNTRHHRHLFASTWVYIQKES